jgi:small-conductance mechanosensitive channel
MSRMKGILVAASLTALVLVTFLALGFGNVIAGPAEPTAAAATLSASTTAKTGNGTVEQQLQAWQDYSHELENTVSIMQLREAQYQQQLAAASQAIGQLQAELNELNPSQARPFFQGSEGFEPGGFND